MCKEITYTISNEVIFKVIRIYNILNRFQTGGI